LFVDSVSDSVGVGNSAPNSSLHVVGNATFDDVYLSMSDRVLEEVGSVRDTESSQGGSATALHGPRSIFVVGDYLYAGSYSDEGLSVVDVSDPSSPVEVGYVTDTEQGGSATTLDDVRGVYVQGDYAYVTSELDDGLSVVDVSDPSSPVEVGAVRDTESPQGGTATTLDGAYGVFVRGIYAYVASYTDDGLSIVDVSDPSSPYEIGSINDSAGGGSGTVLNGACSVYVVGDYAYVASYTDDSLSIIDVSDPSSPVEVGSVNDSSWGGGSASALNGAYGVFVQGSHAYVASMDANGLSVIDVSDPSSPVEVGAVTDSEYGGSASTLEWPIDVFVAGDYAYVSSYGDEGLSVVDVSDPSSPVEVGYVTDTEQGGSASTMDSAWDVFVVGGYAYVASYLDSGISVVSLGGLFSPSAEVGSLKVGGLVVEDSVSVVGGLHSGGLSVGVGGVFVQDELSVQNDTVVLGGFNASKVYVSDLCLAGVCQSSWLGSVMLSFSLGGDSGVVQVVNDSDLLNVSGGDSVVTVVSSTDTVTIDIADDSIDGSELSDTIVLDAPLSVTSSNVSFDSGSLFVDSVSDSVGVGNSAPNSSLHVVGDATFDDVYLSMSDRVLEEVGHINDTSIGGTANLLEGAFDVVLLGDYAYVTSDRDDGLSVVDVSDPSSPFEVGSVNDTERGGTATTLMNARGLAVAGDYAYVASYTNHGLSIVDISNPSSPVEVGAVRDTQSSQGGTATTLYFPWDVFVVGDYAYVAANDGLSVVDVSDPSSPFEVGFVNDTESGGTATTLDGVRDVFVVGDYAYLTSYDDDGLSVVDVSDPSSPFEVGSVNDTGQGGTATTLNSAWSVFVQGGYAYVAANGEDGLSIIDVSDPTAPVEVGVITDDSQGGSATTLDWVTDVFVAGDYAYVGCHQDAGLSVIDVSDPYNPVEVGVITDDVTGGTATTLEGPYGIFVQGNYAYVAGNAWVVDSYDGGLSIISLGGLSSPAAEVGSLQVGSLAVEGGLSAAGSVKVVSGLSVGSGINSKGKISVYDNLNSEYVVDIQNDGNNANRYGIQIQGGADDGTGTTYYLNFLDGNETVIGYCQNNGGTFSCADSSDKKTKRNIQQSSMNALDKIKEVSVKTYGRKQHPVDGPEITGFIAQELQEVFPEAVSIGPDGMLGISRELLVPVLWEGLQEQQEQLDWLLSSGKVASGSSGDLTILQQELSLLRAELEGLRIGSLVEEPVSGRTILLGEGRSLSLVGSGVDGIVRDGGDVVITIQ